MCRVFRSSNGRRLMLSASAISTTDFFFLARITNVTSRKIALA